MRKRSLLLTGGLMAIVAACSSESSTSGGSGGTSGSAGASGSGASAGAGGASGSAGSAGSSGSAGASGSGGTSGAAGSGGAGGSAGSGGANAGCNDLCAAITGAACSKGPTMKGCLLTCKRLTSAATCDPTGLAYMACVKKNGVTCNAAGDPVAKGCGVDYLKAINCAVKENPNPAIVKPCSDYCDKVVAANCPGNGTKDECESNCKWLGATGTGCDGEWTTFLNCATPKTFSCVLGFAVAPGCGADFTAYTKCINDAGT